MTTYSVIHTRPCPEGGGDHGGSGDGSGYDGNGTYHAPPCETCGGAGALFLFGKSGLSVEAARTAALEQVRPYVAKALGGPAGSPVGEVCLALMLVDWKGGQYDLPDGTTLSVTEDTAPAGAAPTRTPVDHFRKWMGDAVTDPGALAEHVLHALSERDALRAEVTRLRKACAKAHQHIDTRYGPPGSNNLDRTLLDELQRAARGQEPAPAPSEQDALYSRKEGRDALAKHLGQHVAPHTVEGKLRGRRGWVEVTADLASFTRYDGSSKTYLTPADLDDLLILAQGAAQRAWVTWESMNPQGPPR